MRNLIWRSVWPWLPENHAKKKKKQFFDPKYLSNFVFDVETRNVGNRPKRVLAKFRADPNHVILFEELRNIFT